MSQSETESAPRQVFEIQKIYLKDVSYEAPNSPRIFTGEWKPQTNLQIQTETQPLDQGVHEVVLSITVTATHDDQTGYLVELKQAGVFTLQGFSDEQLGPLLGSYCPNILFPFAREAIAELISKGGFPHFLLNPVNFDALYAQHLEQQKAGIQEESPSSPTTH